MGFDRAVAFVLDREGGYVNDPKDRGGETKYGISKRAHPALDIKNLTKDDAIAIYRRDYWDGLKCDDLDSQLAFVVFDTAVNMGKGRALALLSQTKDWSVYLLYRTQRYLDIVAKNPSQERFKRGWLRRVEDLRTAVKSLEPEDH